LESFGSKRLVKKWKKKNITSGTKV
jgi:hypothetical protein